MKHDSAFPTAGGWDGITKREYFAAHALQGLLSNTELVGRDFPLNSGRMETLITKATKLAELLVDHMETTEHADYQPKFNPYAKPEESEE